jgi:histidinol-phosphate aminotransferase
VGVAHTITSFTVGSLETSMTTSRRRFLRSLGAGAAVGVATQPPLPGLSRAAIFEPVPSTQDNGLIRLNNNENPYGPSKKVANAIQSSIGSVNRYPLMEYDSLAKRLADVHRVEPEQILLGCGSTEILRMAAFAFLGSGKQLIQASPTFEAIGNYARAASSEVASVPLTPRFSHDLDGMQARVTASTTLVYICNPNNPTASLTPRKGLATFIEKLPTSSLVLIDEAYHHYAGQSGMYASFLDQPVNDKRVIVTRTFSIVYGLAGLRLGYAVASASAVQKMRQFATQYSVDTVVAQAASAALDDLDDVNEFVRRNADDRQEFFNQAMARMLKPIDSHANFVMMDTFHPAEEVIQHFRTHSILIGPRFPAMSTHIRISLGRPEDMQRFWQVWDLLPYPKGTMQH